MTHPSENNESDLKELAALLEFFGRDDALKILSMDADELDGILGGVRPYPAGIREVVAVFHRVCIQDGGVYDDVDDRDTGDLAVEPELNDSDQELALRKLTALLRYMGRDNVLTALAVDDESLDGMLGGDWPWPEETREMMETTFRLYADDAKVYDGEPVAERDEIPNVKAETSDGDEDVPSWEDVFRGITAILKRRDHVLSYGDILGDILINEYVDREAREPLIVVWNANATATERAAAVARLLQLEEWKIQKIREVCAMQGTESTIVSERGVNEPSLRELVVNRISRDMDRFVRELLTGLSKKGTTELERSLVEVRVLVLRRQKAWAIHTVSQCLSQESNYPLEILQITSCDSKLQSALVKHKELVRRSKSVWVRWFRSGG